jgi:hypothetical protein
MSERRNDLVGVFVVGFILIMFFIGSHLR